MRGGGYAGKRGPFSCMSFQVLNHAARLGSQHTTGPSLTAPRPKLLGPAQLGFLGSWPRQETPTFPGHSPLWPVGQQENPHPPTT